MSKTNTNVLVLTTVCNWDCEYCFQHSQDYKRYTLSKEQIKKNVDEIVKAEEGSYSSICLFGGEPFLFWDNLKYAIEYAEQAKDGMFFQINTNGSWFEKTEHCIEYAKLHAVKRNRIDLQISFDVSGNYRRTDKAGNDTTEKTFKILAKLNKFNIPFGISYTIHKANFNHVVSDIEFLCKTFKLQKIYLNVNVDELEHEGMLRAKNVSVRDIYNFIYKKNIFGNKLLNIFQEYRVPICQAVCELCKKCNKDKSADLNYYSNDINIIKEQNCVFDEFAPYLKG